MKRGFILVCLLWLCALPSGAHAQSCSASATQLNFGNVSPIRQTVVNASGTVTVTCTWPAVTLTPNAHVCLNVGSGSASTSISPRYLANGTYQMQFNLYRDSAYSQIWGSTYSGTVPIDLQLSKPLLGNSATQSVTFYGQISSGQPTVPTTGNSSTTYTNDFNGNQTSLNVGFYLVGSPSCASLGTSSGTFGFLASATVVNDCIITATDINFGATGTLNTTLNATGALSVRCTDGDAYRVALNGGKSGNVAARTLIRSGGGAIGYQLYVDAAHTTVWGDGSGSTGTVSGTGTGQQQNLTVYATVPPQSSPVPGVYSDTITATISF